MISKKKFYDAVSSDVADMQDLFEKAFADQTTLVVDVMPYVVPIELNVGFGLVLNDEPYLPAHKRSEDSDDSDDTLRNDQDDTESVRSYGLFMKFGFGFMLGEEEETRTMIQTLVPSESPKHFLKHLLDNPDMLLKMVADAIKDNLSGGNAQ
jgi:hypothetical protein